MDCRMEGTKIRRMLSAPLGNSYYFIYFFHIVNSHAVKVFTLNFSSIAVSLFLPYSVRSNCDVCGCDSGASI